MPKTLTKTSPDVALDETSGKPPKKASSKLARKPASKRQPLTADTLWQLQRVGPPSLSPDGKLLACSMATPSVADNNSSSALWLLTTELGGAPPRRLTHCGGKDGQPAWSPQGDCIAFVARREQQGSKDTAAQLYVIAPDGGEARRVSDFAPGIDSFKWLPDGKRIVFTAWVWPELKGAKAQSKRQKEFADRKESGYSTSAAYYRYWDDNVPLGRALRLLLLDVASGRITDLFEGTPYELPRHAGDNDVYDVRPDGKRIVFVHDPAADPVITNALALVELDLRSKTFTALTHDPAWDIAAPRYSPDSGASGSRIALLAAHVGRHHTALQQPAILDTRQPRQPPQLLDAAWDHDVHGPLAWTVDGRALLFTSEEAGRCHLWRHDLPADAADEAGKPGAFSIVHRGGTVQGFDVAGGTAVFAADSAQHPVQLFALALDQPGGSPVPARRLDTFNDALLATLAFGDVQEIQVTGALGEPVQVWLTFPPGFDPSKKHPLLHMIHGGPYAAAGDTFGLRWNPHVFAAPSAATKAAKDGKGKEKKRHTTGHRGRVVAQVNFHGSSGFGWAFRHSLIGRQGELELQDIEAATDWLVQQPWADTERIAAAGGSYGGFLVAWMNGNVPAWPAGRYRAYVCHAGVFDRVATFSADSYAERPKDLAAKYWENMPRVLAQSPHNFAGTMATPTLVTHGAQDFRVPDCNGLAYYNTLKARGVDARLLWFPDENHWVLKPQNSLLWYREFAAWIGRFA